MLPLSQKTCILSRSDYFRFGSVFIQKKVTKPNFLKKKTETGSKWPVSARFGFLGQKSVQTGLARFGSVLARFFCLVRFDLVLARFFWFCSFFSGLARVFFVFFYLGSVRFFRFQTYKTGTESVGFFKILIGLIGVFSRFSFFSYFFLVFSVFLLTSNFKDLKKNQIFSEVI